MFISESETMELKKSTSELKEAIISIVAILNKHQQGELYFGITNDGTVVGQTVGEKTIRDISKAISDFIEPKIYPEINQVVIEDKTCIHIQFNGLEIPYYAYGRAYIRVADEDKKISAKELENIILYKNRDALRWDNLPSEKTSTDINENSLMSFVKQAHAVGRLDYAYDNKKIALTKLKLLNDDHLLNAGEALFCDDNSLEVQLAIFAGLDRLTFLDIKQLKGNLFYLLNESELYIKDHINWRVKFGKLEREEIPEVPINAIREALVNSFCHRDYRIPKSNSVAIYKDRIEIYNPGDFPQGLTPQDFIEGKESSVLRNPLVAEILYLSKDIEKWGSGIKRIFDECQANNVKVEFEIRKTGFFVTFYRPGISTEPQKQFTEQVPSKYRASTEQVQKILLFCATPRNRQEIMDYMQLKHREHFRAGILAPLLWDNLIEMTIPDKPNSSRQQYVTSLKGLESLK